MRPDVTGTPCRRKRPHFNFDPFFTLGSYCILGRLKSPGRVLDPEPQVELHDTDEPLGEVLSPLTLTGKYILVALSSDTAGPWYYSIPYTYAPAKKGVPGASPEEKAAPRRP